MQNSSEIKILNEKQIRKFIWDNIDIKTDGEITYFTIPWHLGETVNDKSTPLTLTLKKVKVPHENLAPLRQKNNFIVIDTQRYDSYELSDGGRAISELEKKVKDITPYLPRIKNILYDTGMHELKGGRIITKTYELYSPHIPVRNLDGFLTALTIIANLDIMPNFTVSKYSSERNK